MNTDHLFDLLAPVVADLGLECLGLEYIAGSATLRVYIDVTSADAAVNVDDCEKVSREISALLDVEDPIAGRYTLEVSSPGLDRPLFTPAQFARFTGEVVAVTLNLPIGRRRRFRGPIIAVAGDVVTIEHEGEAMDIEHVNIGKARLVPDYSALEPTPTRDDRRHRGRKRNQKSPTADGVDTDPVQGTRAGEEK